MPLRRASVRKPAASASDTRLEIVMVNRSLAAANAIRAGNSRRRAMSRIMAVRCPRLLGGRVASLTARNEQSGNGQPYHQRLAIRTNRATSASASARQTSSVGASGEIAAGSFFAAEAETGLRIRILNENRPKVDG